MEQSKQVSDLLQSIIHSVGKLQNLDHPLDEFVKELKQVDEILDDIIFSFE